MNMQERKWFDELSQKRKRLINALEENDGLEDIITLLTELYTEPAHFIYELLQNADDANATEAKFILKKDGMSFIHNGIRHFNITNPSTEKADKETGIIGDINAITFFKKSGKIKAEDPKIGKFGIGFKSVFRYTNNPEIYDDNFKFVIKKVFVPETLEHDHPPRSVGETLIYLPFNKSTSSDNSFRQISNALNHLKYPTLFLHSLNKLVCNIDGEEFSYGKITLTHDNRHKMHNTMIQRVKISSKQNLERQLFTFTRGESRKSEYSIAFEVKDNKIIPVNEKVFCFFTTQVDSKLKFLIHAPFSLTNSREGIVNNDTHNLDMIEKLAVLAGDALLYFRDISTEENRYITSDIFNIIPTDEKEFGEVENTDNISFKPFFTEIRKRFETECLMPGKDHCVSKEHAYWANTVQLMDLFSNIQLKQITGDSEAEWILNRVGRDTDQGAKIRNYVDGLICKSFVDDGKSDRNILHNLKAKFIEMQSVEWILALYKWCVANSERLNEAKNCPIFLNQEHLAVCANGLFLPDNNIKDMPCIHSSLVDNVEIKKILVEKFGFTKPSKLDYISNNVIPKYKNSVDEKEMEMDFKICYEYYSKECTNDQMNDYIDRIKGLPFIKTIEGNYSKASELYLPNSKTKDYLDMAKIGNVIDIDYYLKTLSDNSTEELLNELNRFFSKLGARNDILINDVIDCGYCLHTCNYKPNKPNGQNCKKYQNALCQVAKYYNPQRDKLEYEDAIKLLNTFGIGHGNSTTRNGYYEKWYIERIINLYKVLSEISMNKNVQGSCCLWHTLVDNFSSVNKISCKYEYYKNGYLYPVNILPPDIVLLRSFSWVVNVDNEFVAPQSINKSQLSPNYDVTSQNAISLCDYLKICEPPQTNEIDSDKHTIISKEGKILHLEEENESLKQTVEQKDKENESLKQTVEQKDKEIERLKAEIAEKDRKEEERKLKILQQAKSSTHYYQSNSYANAKSASNSDEMDADNYNTDPDFKEHPNHVRTITNDIEIRVDKLNSNKHRSHRIAEVNSNNTELQLLEQDDCFDEDDVVSEEDYDNYNPIIVDYQKKIEKEKDAAAIRIGKIQTLESLQSNAHNAIHYSFEWFKTLLEIEMNNQSEDVNRRKKIAISFSKIEREPDTERTFILRFPNRYIPNEIEELSGFPMSLRFGKQSSDNIIVEAASIRSFTLRIKLKDVSQISNIPLDKVHEIHITADSPDFLLRALYDNFSALGLSNDYNMKQKLNPDIEFVYGPPGTGKTTYLCNNYLINWLTGNKDFKVLVLTPTNKSADVVVNRLMSIMEREHSDCSHQEIIRFGSTLDEQIEKIGIYKDRMFEFNKCRRPVVVTTIARFPYDYFIQRDSKIYLKDISWDYIVIDEASMIPLANIIYPLYKTKPKMFVIAGDPFQIQPIVTSELWKDENIYTMVGLESFTDPKTQPHDYQVHKLCTQYRSIPCIGELFSQLAYGGVLNHNRDYDSVRQLNLSSEIELKPLTIVKYPTSKYDSIYKCKRLNNSSPYHIYSALFAYEFSNWLSQNLLEHNPDTHYSIGIISPYKIQASLVDRLLARTEIPNNVNIQAGTIHGFQGDECDIIIALFNPPPSISNGCFLNNLNIINVAISRARDCLIMVMPDDNTENVSNLILIKHLERLMSKSDKYVCYSASDLEKIMFNNPHFLEDNSFSTNHQSVNVYAKPERKYEVRCEDSAVDIQIHME